MSTGPPHFIESEQNPVFKDLRKLLSPRGIKKQGRALLSGSRLTAEALRRIPGRCRFWVVPAGAGPEAMPPEDAPAGLRRLELAPGLYRELDLFGTDDPLLVLDVPVPDRWDPAEGLPGGVSVLIPFQDPENAGAAVRSAAAFGVDRVILLAESAHPFHPKTLRSSGGAVLAVPLLEGPSIHDLPEDPGILALSGEGRDLATFRFPDRFALLPGVEGPGLPRRLRARALSIPIRPEVESLNAAAAVAVALYAWRQGGRGEAAG